METINKIQWSHIPVEEKTVLAVIEKYTPLIRKLRKRYATGPTFTHYFSDIYSWGVVGLLEALYTYNPNKGASFDTHAGNKIRTEIRRFVWDFTHAVHIPDYQKVEAISSYMYYDELNLDCSNNPLDIIIKSDLADTAHRVLTNELARLSAEDQKIIKSKWLNSDHIKTDQWIKENNLPRTSLFRRQRRIFKKLRSRLPNNIL